MSSTAKFVAWFIGMMLVSAFLMAAHAHSAEAAPAGDDPALEQRVTALAAELRCLVCQNQTIADSNAGLAVDLKNQIREKLKQGESESQIIDFMVQRYGDFVLYRPPVKMTTVLLWFGPVLIMLIGLVVLYRKVKSQGAASEPRLTQGDHERAERLLKSDIGDDAA